MRSFRMLRWIPAVAALTFGFAGGALADTPGLVGKHFTMELPKEQVFSRADAALKLSKLTIDSANEVSRGGHDNNVRVIVACLEVGKISVVDVEVANNGPGDQALALLHFVSDYIRTGTAQTGATGLTGDWTTVWTGGASHPMRLTQKGDKITGTYEGGSLEGTLTGNILRFRWTQSDGTSGTGKFEFTPDRKRFTGSYTYTNNSDAADYYWNGTRDDAKAEEKSK